MASAIHITARMLINNLIFLFYIFVNLEKLSRKTIYYGLHFQFTLIFRAFSQKTLSYTLHAYAVRYTHFIVDTHE